MPWPTSDAQARRIKNEILPKEKAMTPMLTIETITAENEFRHARIRSSFEDQNPPRSRIRALLRHTDRTFRSV